MNKKKCKIFFLLLLNIGLMKVHAQRAVLSAGGDAHGMDGTASYSIGQIDYIAIDKNTGYVNQGVQQPYIPAVLLPVTALELTATKQENRVLLSWQTSTEINSSKFIVERSANAVNFSELGQVKASGNSNNVKRYTLDDLKPLPGTNFYRVKEVDIDGKFIFSKVVGVNFNAIENAAIVYPNPGRDKFTLKVPGIGNRSLNYILYDMKGALLTKNLITSSLTIVQINTLSPGTYYLELMENNINIKIFKIIKAK